jgi:uroporphyrinogen decarboxylase
MTSRERVLAAVEHRQPDRVPVDLGATPSSGISAIAYGNLKRHLGITRGRTRIYDVVQQLAQPEDFILDRFGVDAIDIGRAFNTEAPAWDDVALADGQPAQYPAWFHPERQPDGSFIARLKDGTDIAHMPAGGTFSTRAVFPISMVTRRTSATSVTLWERSSGRPSPTARGITRTSRASGTRCGRGRWHCAALATAR